MPYVLVDQNRYIGEHSCNRYHYGDMTIVRDCCVADCQKWAAQAKRVALTTSHPAYQMYQASWNALTDAEMSLCPNFTIDSESRRIDLRLCKDSEDI